MKQIRISLLKKEKNVIDNNYLKNKIISSIPDNYYFKENINNLINKLKINKFIIIKLFYRY